MNQHLQNIASQLEQDISQVEKIEIANGGYCA